MNRNVFWLVSVFVFSAMLVLSSGYVQAQITGFIPVFVDEFGSEDVSIISQNADRNVGIGGPPEGAGGWMLKLSDFRNGRVVGALFENMGPFSAAGVRFKTPAAGNDWTVVGTEDGAGNADAFRISNSMLGAVLNIKAGTGNVGIGTSSPTAKLHVIGNFVATGSKSALVETASYGKRQLYAVESPENWFEDFGKAKLINGQAVVKLDPIFSETVSTENEYHVFLTPKGDCEGLYIANQTAGSFEVRELRKGKSNVAFDYRIIAKRKGYEQDRLAEVKDVKEPQSKEIKLAQSLK